jgi:hypothetical protein
MRAPSRDRPILTLHWKTRENTPTRESKLRTSPGRRPSTWSDRYQRAQRDAERTGAHVRPSEFFETAELEIEHLEGSLADEVVAAIKDRERELRRHQTAVLGMQRVLQSSPFDRPRMSARSRMPLCFASSREARRVFADGWYAFVGAFREASASFRSGFLGAIFPRFSFRPITSTA